MMNSRKASKEENGRSTSTLRINNTMRRYSLYHYFIHLYAIIITIALFAQLQMQIIDISPTSSSLSKTTTVATTTINSKLQQGQRYCDTIVCQKFQQDFKERTKQYDPNLEYVISNPKHAQRLWSNQKVISLIQKYILYGTDDQTTTSSFQRRRRRHSQQQQQQNNPQKPIRYGEIGVFKGDTLLGVVQGLPPNSEIHIFDKEPAINATFTNIGSLALTKNVSLVAHVTPNGGSMVDYNLDLLQLCLQVKNSIIEPWDFIYVDGAHTFHNDALAFVFVDCMLRPNGGLVAFDDYDWTLASSPTTNKDLIKNTLPSLLIDQPQIHVVVENVVKDIFQYETLVEKVLYKKTLKKNETI